MKKQNEYLTVDALALDFENALSYVKRATVHIRQSKPGERLETRLKSGLLETERTLTGEEFIIITNPSGEEYAVSREHVTDNYVQNADGSYASRGTILAIKNPVNKKIRVKAPWGEQCVIAQNGSPEDRYIIGFSEFEETYVLENK